MQKGWFSMSIQRKYAWMVLITWIIVLVVFLLLFFSGSGPSEWGSNSTKRIIAAIFFGIGYIVFFTLQIRNKKSNYDERDTLIQLKAGNSAMVIVLMFVFILSIGSFVIYEEEGQLPISWMWFLGYSTVFLTYIVNSGLYLYYEKREQGYGRN